MSYVLCGVIHLNNSRCEEARGTIATQILKFFLEQNMHITFNYYAYDEAVKMIFGNNVLEYAENQLIFSITSSPIQVTAEDLIDYGYYRDDPSKINNRICDIGKAISKSFSVEEIREWLLYFSDGIDTDYLLLTATPDTLLNVCKSNLNESGEIKSIKILISPQPA